ncbi:uncharacterized protein LOC107036205 [Diachasma alloeum]|uniref:uncharacterized protein LOC107036205 n=1 Tax=Diachasma alloeum TaxID=454923 RepID=UPI0007383584|nr:uncharacterized protein LOC107036205 [Diachasma alloeum]
MHPGTKVDTMDAASETMEEEQEKPQVNPSIVVRVPVKHTNLGIRSPAMDMSTMVELTSFSTLGKIQPFLVTISTTAALIVDLHCHLTDKEVCGYLGGHWDINSHNLSITNAFPCRYAGKDKTAASMVEAEIAKAMEWHRVTLVGWYHSHPRSHAAPSLRDVDYQLDYQIKMKGPSDNGYTPCVGLICSPYNADGNCYESNFNVFWSMPPPENRPHEYPRPMLLSYTITQEPFLPQDALDEIKKCIEYYKSEGGIDFKLKFTASTTYLDRLRTSLASKLPGRNRGTGSGYWEVIKEMISPGSKDDSPEAFVSVPYPPLPLSEPLAQTPGTLASTNVFLAPVNFKPDTTITSSVTKQFALHPPTSSREKEKDDLKERSFKPDRDIHPTFRSGELTVSVKNSKIDFDPPPVDFTKLAPLSLETLNKIRGNLPPDFPIPDISQQIIPDLSKLASFTPADLAKLSGFSLSELTKSPASSVYARNIANLFGPLAKGVPLTPSQLKDLAGERKGEFGGEGLMGGYGEELMGDRKKGVEEVGKGRPTDFTTAEELSISSVRPDFGAMLDMGVLGKKEPGESLNLSMDRQ